MMSVSIWVADNVRYKTRLLLLTLVIALLGLRLWHIQSDFPGYHFYSQDGAKFTDEGFYTGAALHHLLLGHAYIPGGWNPGVFMPVWPLMVGAIFHFTGISVVAARSLAVMCTWISVLLAYAVARQYRSHMFASIAALLLAANALGFFFARLAILEPAFVMFLLLTIYLAGKVKPGNYALAIFVGIIFTIATLTKTTGPFVLPAILYPIWARNREQRSAAWKLLAVTVGVVFLFLGYAKFVWSHYYLTDSQIILAMNPLAQIEHSLPRLLRFFFRGTWVDPVLFPIALLGSIAATFRLRFLWSDTLFVTAFLWEAGYAAFIVFHYDGPPRYFSVLIIPTIWLALIFMEWLWQERRPVALLLTTCVAISFVWNLAYVADYLAHPRYTLLDASMEIKQAIETDTTSNKLLIGRGADEISLLSGGLPTMDSDGAMPLAEKISVYHPGWLMRWMPDTPQRLISVKMKTRVVEQARFHVFNPTEHATVVLYKLLPKK
jgi:4-amino-4-deoxy-L-arabinose transferase-like glycosyltransferase